MTDRAVLDHMMALMRDVMPHLPDPDYRPTGVRMNPATAYLLADTYRMPPPPTWGPDGRYELMPPLFGLTVIVDRDLPPGVIRLVDGYGRLVRDSRSES